MLSNSDMMVLDSVYACVDVVTQRYLDSGIQQEDNEEEYVRDIARELLLPDQYSQYNPCGLYGTTTVEETDYISDNAATWTDHCLVDAFHLLDDGFRG